MNATLHSLVLKIFIVLKIFGYNESNDLVRYQNTTAACHSFMLKFYPTLFEHPYDIVDHNEYVSNMIGSKVVLGILP